MTETHYIVMSSWAKMPTSCWGRYRRVALLEVEKEYDLVSMISERARGVVRIIKTWEKCHYGRGGSGRCAYSRACTEAVELKRDMEHMLSAPHPNYWWSKTWHTDGDLPHDLSDRLFSNLSYL